MNISNVGRSSINPGVDVQMIYAGFSVFRWTQQIREAVSVEESGGTSRRGARLIEQFGYWRRKEDLEDAEAAAKDW